MSENTDNAEGVMNEAAAPPAVDPPPPAPMCELPGCRLKEAREARGLSVADVAHSLKFSPRQIEAIEADDYASLPQATFLRGFVRGYAKLLKLDPEPLLAMLSTSMPVAPPDVRPPSNMGVAAVEAAGETRSSLPFLIGTTLLALVAAGLGAWHFMGKPSTTVVTKSPNSVAAVSPPDIRVEPSAEPTAAPAQQPAATPLPPDMKQLVFTFQGKSWVEVKDASQRIVLTGEYLAGARQVAVGKPPFQLVVGNAAGVELQYEDQQVDLKPHIRAEVARLTLQ